MSGARPLLRSLARPLDRPMLAMLLGVLALGCLIQYSTHNADLPAFGEHVLRVAAGLAVLVLVAQASPAQLRQWTVPAVLVCIALLALVPFFGTDGGARRWLDLRLVTLQPSEFLKLALLSLGPLPPTFLRIVLTLALFAGCAGAVALQPDLGTAALLMGTGLSLIVLAGISGRLVFGFVVLVGSSLPFVWSHLLLEYQKVRIRTFLNPESDPLGAGYNIIQSKIAIGAGGSTGRGWTQGTQAQFDFLPEQSTDFIFSAYAEEFGLIGVILLIGLYFGILVRLAMYFEATQSPYLRLLLGGLGLSFLLHVLLNISMSIGYAPVTGSPLPLMSYGGSALLATLASFGVAMAIHHHTRQRTRVAQFA